MSSEGTHPRSWNSKLISDLYVGAGRELWNVYYAITPRDDPSRAGQRRRGGRAASAKIVAAAGVSPDYLPGSNTSIGGP